MLPSYYFSDGASEIAEDAAMEFLVEPRPAAGYTNIIRRLASYTGPVLPTPETPLARHGQAQGHSQGSFASPGRGRDSVGASPSRGGGGERGWTKEGVLSAADALRGPKPSSSSLILGFAHGGMEEIDEASLEKLRKLEAENAQLRQKIRMLEAIHAEEEDDLDNLGRFRMRLLKAQNMQLEQEVIALSSSVAGTQAARTEVLAVIKELRQRTKDVKRMPSIVVAKPGHHPPPPPATGTAAGPKGQGGVGGGGKMHLSASAEVGPTFDKKEQAKEERRHSYPFNTSTPVSKVSKSLSGPGPTSGGGRSGAGARGGGSGGGGPRPSSAFLSSSRRDLWGGITDDDTFPPKSKKEGPKKGSRIVRPPRPGTSHGGPPSSRQTSRTHSTAAAEDSLSQDGFSDTASLHTVTSRTSLYTVTSRTSTTSAALGSRGGGQLMRGVGTYTVNSVAVQKDWLGDLERLCTALESRLKAAAIPRKWTTKHSDKPQSQPPSEDGAPGASSSADHTSTFGASTFGGSASNATSDAFSDSTGDRSSICTAMVPFNPAGANRFVAKEVEAEGAGEAFSTNLARIVQGCLPLVQYGQVHDLEERLGELYPRLLTVSKFIESIIFPGLPTEAAEGVKEEVRMAVKSLHQASRCLGELAALVPAGVHLRGFGPDKAAQDLCRGVAGYDYEPEDIPANLLSQFPSVDDIMSALPRSWRSVEEEDQARLVLRGVVDKLRNAEARWNAERRATENEIEFYRTCHAAQSWHVNQVVSAGQFVMESLLGDAYTLGAAAMESLNKILTFAEAPMEMQTGGRWRELMAKEASTLQQFSQLFPDSFSAPGTAGAFLDPLEKEFKTRMQVAFDKLQSERAAVARARAAAGLSTSTPFNPSLLGMPSQSGAIPGTPMGVPGTPGAAAIPGTPAFHLPGTPGAFPGTPSSALGPALPWAPTPTASATPRRGSGERLASLLPGTPRGTFVPSATPRTPQAAALASVASTPRIGSIPIPVPSTPRVTATGAPGVHGGVPETPRTPWTPSAAGGTPRLSGGLSGRLTGLPKTISASERRSMLPLSFSKAYEPGKAY